MPLLISHALNFAFKTIKSLPPSIPKWVFKQTHMMSSHHQLKPFNSKLSSFMRNGLVEDAQKLFDEMPQRNTVTWNAMIRGYFQNSSSERAIRLFRQMPSRDIYSYNTVIGGLMCCGDVKGAKDVFETMDFRDVVTWNSMISGFIHNGMLNEAVSVFDTMPVKDVVSWNLVIGGLLNYDKLDFARKLFDEMGARDFASWTIMMSGFVNAGLIDEARQLFDQMPVKDTRAWNKIIEGYVKNGDIENAEILFRRMLDHDLDSWRVLISGLVCSRRISDAIRLFFEMPNKCQKLLNMIISGLIENGLVKPAHGILEKTPFTDVVSLTNLIVGYFGAAEVETATKIFDQMPVRDTAVWNATIFGLGENDRGEEGLKLFIKMRDSGQFPDKSTFTSVLKICSELPSLDLGEQTHAQVIKTGFSSTTAVSNALITMYARCGNMNSSLSEFRSMPTRDLISWNSIICGYAHHGDGEKALKMFEKMALTDIKPNHITFVGVLSACCHSGLIDKGKLYFNLMRHEYSIQPTREHYTCIVDMLGRQRLLKEAVKFLEEMKSEGVEIPASVWGALLGACRMYKNVEIGEVAGRKVLEIEDRNSGVYLILAEMFMECGRVGDAEGVLGLMKEKGVKKQPGCSWIEVNNQGHVFLAGDGAHPQFDTICFVLRLLHRDREFGRDWLCEEIETELVLFGES